MLKLTVGTLAVLLSISLVGTTFAGDRNYIELDDSDYGVVQSDIGSAVVTQNKTQASDTGEWVSLIELDESDYATNHNKSGVTEAVAQNNTSAPSYDSWVNLIELDESDYNNSIPVDSTYATERVLCAGSKVPGQSMNCG